ncbi:archaeal proteasome endopeptidase complex subunit alpha [Candidatus Woesearchaeota archaeon]|nr:archaeal proteasome endopeptidase complex subunit alpha [Candidatus Woesearchaeota archaeon]
MQQPAQHQMMGYDRTSAMFSPDGRLLQVEYAKKTVKQGTSALGIVCKDGVLLVADKRITEKLIITSSVEKIFQVDEHIGATASGILSDGRMLIERAQIVAQQHRITFDEPVDVISLVKDICDMKQFYTQVGGARPFGVSLLFAGITNGKPELYMTDPTGIFFAYKATAMGEAETELKEILEKQYRDNMPIEDALKLAVRALKKVLGKEFDIERIDGAYITTKEKRFTKINKDKLTRIS